MGENTLYLDFPGNEVKPIFGSDQVWTATRQLKKNFLGVDKDNF